MSSKCNSSSCRRKQVILDFVSSVYHLLRYNIECEEIDTCAALQCQRRLCSSGLARYFKNTCNAGSSIFCTRGIVFGRSQRVTAAIQKSIADPAGRHQVFYRAPDSQKCSNCLQAGKQRMSRIVADIMFHVQSQRRGRWCLQFECDFMFLFALTEQCVAKADQAALFGGWLYVMEKETVKWYQHVVRTRPPAIKTNIAR